MERRKQNFLQKLYSREVHGTFERGRPVVHDKAIKLFGSIPDRLMFCVADLIESIGNQIVMGTTRCGQFLITYSYATDLRLPVQVFYKYRLHWWAFRPGSQAYKVAEVQLFDDQDITYSLTVGIAQWPNVSDKLIVYGFSDDSDPPYDHDEGGLESRKYFITVTTLPSLHDCKDCKAVAESFDEEDMAANWDTAVSLSCLKHGLTIHTTLDIAPPYPAFDFFTNLKIDNKIIVNTGNFLHVLSFTSDKEEIKPSKDDSIVPAEIHHKIGEILSNDVKGYICPWKDGSTSSPNSRKTLTRSVNKAWLNTIMDEAEKVYAFEESDDGCEPRFKWFKKRRLADKMYEFCSDDEDMENKCPAKLPRLLESSSRLERRMTNDLSGDDSKEAKCSEECWKIVKADKPKIVLPRSTHVKVESRRQHESVEVHNKFNVPIDNPYDPICYTYSLRDPYDVMYEIDHVTYQPTTNKTNKRRYEFNSQQSVRKHDNTRKNVFDTDVSKNDCDVPQRNASDIGGSKNDCDNYCNNLVNSDSCNPPMSSTSEGEVRPSISEYHKTPTLDLSIINPDLSAILAEWEPDSVSSLSPRSDSFHYKNGETKNDVIQSFLELIPGMTISPRSSNSSSRNSDGSSVETSESFSPRLNEITHSGNKAASPNSSSNKYPPLLVVLRTRNCNPDKDLHKLKEQGEKLKPLAKEEVAARVKPAKETDSMRQRIISGCSVRFDRIYIEVDEEIMSTITDIEDDDQGTGFHCALPLSVHGSAYAELQMVSSHKAEKMNIHCERVLQTSLDIEQFCFKAADIICKCEGFKFWFCNDYDVEIIDVCALNGDVLGVVNMRVNAEKKPTKSEKRVHQRYFYDLSCVFIWNLGTDRCWLEAYSSLVDVTMKCLVSEKGVPVRHEADRLRDVLDNSTLFTLVTHPPIRSFEHRMWVNDLLRPSVEEIRDHTNLVGFRLHPHRPVGSSVHFLN